MNDFKLQVKIFITKGKYKGYKKYMVEVDAGYTEYTEEFYKLTEILVNSDKSIELLEQSYTDTKARFNTRDEVYKYIFENSKDLVEKGVRLKINEKY
jgi:hypothetical protein